jgi:protein-S-isoprenylcysteine O-methyltransferase Ste14
MYLGGFAVLVGAGLMLSSPSIVLLAFGFLLLAHAFVVLYEEPNLTASFGEGYRRYRSTVPRWWIGRRP